MLGYKTPSPSSDSTIRSFSPLSTLFCPMSVIELDPNPFDALRDLTIKYDDLFSPTDCEFIARDVLREQLIEVGVRMVRRYPLNFSRRD